MKSKTFSLRRKLLAWLLLPMLLLWLLSGISAYYLSSRFANTAFDRILADCARDLALQMTVSNGRASLDLPPPALQMFLSDEYDKIYYKVTEAGRLIAGEPDLPMPDISGSPGSPAIMHYGFFGGKRIRIASRYFLPPGITSGKTVLIQVAETLNKRRMLVREIITVTVLQQLILTALAALAVWLGIGRGLAPLKHLRREIASRSYLNLSPVQESDAPQEVRPVLHSINEFMHRLGEALEAQQKFIANAAHQLRTPISGLKTQTDLALRQSDPETLRHSLQLLSTSTDRTVRLVNQMLALAQVEPLVSKESDMKPLNLNELIRETTMEWVPFALRKNIDLGYEGPDRALMIEGDRFRIKMLIDNLLDNAIRYSHRGGCVTAKVAEADKSVIVTVEDNGPGIPQEERKAVFQRFYRIPDNSGDGSGLGLSIVQEVAEIHGAKVFLDEPAGHPGTSVSIVFPKS